MCHDKILCQIRFYGDKKFKMMKTVYSESDVLCVIVEHWHLRFREWRELFKDKERSSRLVMTNMDVNVARVAIIMKEDRRVVRRRQGHPKTSILNDN